MNDHGFFEAIKSDRYRVFQRKKEEIWGDDRTCIFATNDRFQYMYVAEKFEGEELAEARSYLRLYEK